MTTTRKVATILRDVGHGRIVFPGATVPDRLRAFAEQFDRRLEKYLSPVDGVPVELLEAVRSSALAPGKRVRPYLVMTCCKLVGGRASGAWPAAAAVECVHAFSLIHDDLPALDDDDLRRGLPTCHKEFGEATAILAGDALLALSFELLSRHVRDPELAVKMVTELARASGWAGMIGGELADLLGESHPPELELTQRIHEQKTGALFRSACCLGALAGYADAKTRTRLSRFGQSLGRAFQIADDLLDVSTATNQTGKRVGKDESAGKQSFPRCVGIERARTAAREAVQDAIEVLKPFGAKADDLRALAVFVMARDY